MYAGETFEVEVADFTFRVKVKQDIDMGAPWEEHDGHGVVSERTIRTKRPGEVALCGESRCRRYYDFAESMKIARRDGWGLRDEDKAVLLERLCRPVMKYVPVPYEIDGVAFLRHERVEHIRRGAAKPLNRGEIRAEAVRLDYEYLRRWCSDQWYWVGLVVELLDDEGEPVEDLCDSLWGMESDCDDYLRETAQDMAEGLATGLLHEAAERRYWNERDVETV